jgi:hypothetical protein
MHSLLIYLLIGDVLAHEFRLSISLCDLFLCRFGVIEFFITAGGALFEANDMCVSWGRNVTNNFPQ